MTITLLVISFIAILIISIKHRAVSAPEVVPIPGKIPINQHQHKCPVCETIWAHGPSFVLGKDGHKCPVCGTEQYSKYHPERESNTLGEFLLSRFMGALLKNNEPVLLFPGSIEAVVNQPTEYVRFKFIQEKPSLEEVKEVLIEHYKSLGWRIDIQEPQQGRIVGNVYTAETETSLTLISFYTNEDTDVLVMVTNSSLV